MFEALFWIYMSSLIAVVLTKINYNDLPDPVKKVMRQRWEECCERNFCLHNSCYIVQWSTSSWASVRQRCQSHYPEWPFSVDSLRIQNEADIETFWSVLQNPLNKENVKTLWTSGVSCPQTHSGEKFFSRWASSDQPFPSWLDEKLSNATSSKSIQSNGCRFLAITPAPNAIDVKYEFKDQIEKYSTICEFSVPERRTRPETTTQRSTLSTSTSTKSSVVDTSETEHASRTQESTLKTTTTSTFMPRWKTDTSVISSTSTGTPRYCKGRTESGIRWPDTPAGVIARQKCPNGMMGFALWECNESTSKFHPTRPNTEGCKHKWIDHLEDSINEREDAVEISKRLAQETKHNNISHGDIIALVNVTSNLFKLYIEQKNEEEFENYQKEEMFVYYNFTKTMISSISNILRVQIKEAWEILNDTRQTKEASTILKLVTTMGSRLSCMKTSPEKLQFTVSEENINLQTFILSKTNEINGVITFPQETGTIKSNSAIVLPANLKLEKWYSPCKTYNSAVGVIYKHVGDFLKAGQSNSSSKVATSVLGFSLSNGTESISLGDDYVNITLQHRKMEIAQNQKLENPRCVFWNFSKSVFGEWDDTGCDLLYFNATHTVCQCNHLTNFAVLMDINDNIQDDRILTVMTYVCCGFSSLSLIITLVCFLVIRSLHGRRSIITGNLCFSLLITNVLIVFGLDKTQNKIVCAVLAGVLHYWILSAFCWMLVEGYHLYRMVILVFQRGSNLPVKFYYIFAYGSPLVVVAVSAGLRNEGYGGSKYCWLSPDDRGLMWSFVGPACAIILVNVVIFILTLRSASSVKIKKEQSTVKKIKSWIRGSISVMCLLGLTWCIGLFYINKQLHFFSYIFTILNGLQGVFIFLFHILLNDKVNNFFTWKENKFYGNKKFFNHTSSNQTQSKTSTRTSLNSLGCTSSTRLPESRNMENVAPLPRCRLASNGNIQPALPAKNYKKNSVAKTVSVPSVNGFKQSTTFHDNNIKL